jgi:GT2 family glycosyltransferase
MTTSLVSVCIVTWNSGNVLPATLDALARQSYSNLEIIAVDNGSNDDSIIQVKTRFQNAKVIPNRENLGFAGGHNQGIQASQGDYYLALNPDVSLQGDYIFKMVESLESHPTAGTAAGKLLRMPKVIDTTGLFMNRWRQQYLRGHGEMDSGQYDEPEEVFGADGAAPLYRRDMLEDIKIDGQYFDESFFSHKEDVDVAWRARLLGWGCWYTPDAIAFHERFFKPGQRESISPAIRIHAIKNRYLLLAKNELISGWKRDGLQILLYDLKIFVYLCLFERSSLKAVSILRRLWPQTRAWRRETMARMRVSPAEMLAWFK